MHDMTCFFAGPRLTLRRPAADLAPSAARRASRRATVALEERTRRGPVAAAQTHRRTAMFRRLLLAAAASVAASGTAGAAEISISCGAVGLELQYCKSGADAWAKKTGNTVKVVSTPNDTNERLALYQQLLSAGVRRHRRVPDRRDLARHPRQQLHRSGALLQGRGEGAFPGDRRQQHGRRQARRHALVHRCRRALLPQGPARQIRRQAAGDLAGADRRRGQDPGRRAQGRQRQVLGLRLPGQGL